MRHVVERCPSCAVEHDEPVGGACEACGAPLRAWCRRHGGEAGWLAGPACPRCVEESARRAAPAPRTVCYAPAPDRPPAAPPTRVAAPAAEPGDEAEERIPARRPGVHAQVMDILLLLVVNATIGALVGLTGGGLYTVLSGGHGPAAAVEWAVVGGVIGLVVGIVRDVLSSLAAFDRESRR